VKLSRVLAVVPVVALCVVAGIRTSSYGSPSKMPRGSVLALTAFLRLARAGLNGTFTATYQLRGVRGEGFTNATVTLGQRSAPAKSAYETGSGEW
jgi:hypothetical protein